jgi:hypothetical protein
MSKPVPPTELCPVIAERFELSADNRRDIAAALGLPGLPPPIVRTLEAGIARYKMQSRLPFVTVGKNVAAINEALEALDAAEKALRPFRDTSHSGVGSKTVHALNSSACEVHASIRKFRIEAQARREELRRYKRFGAEHGPLGGLCALVRFVFEIVQEAREAEPKKKLLRTFALAVLQAADIPCDDYHIHPSRMDKLFTPEIRDDKFAAQLHKEIESCFSAKYETGLTHRSRHRRA